MKTLFVLILLFIASNVQAQGYGEEISYADTLLGAGDSTFTLSNKYAPSGKWSYVELTVIDSGGTSNQVIDSLYAYVNKNVNGVANWSRVGLRDLLTFTDKQVTDAGNGTRTYLILDPSIFDLFIRRTNVDDIDRRTIIIISLKR